MSNEIDPEAIHYTREACRERLGFDENDYAQADKHLDRMFKEVDHVDAAVFSGDSLYNENTLEAFQLYIDRWQRAINEQRKTNYWLRKESEA